MHQEVDIERIIRQRSLDLFRSRCPSHPLTPAPPSLVDPDNPADRDARGRRKGRDQSGGVRWNG